MLCSPQQAQPIRMRHTWWPRSAWSIRFDNQNTKLSLVTFRECHLISIHNIHFYISGQPRSIKVRFRWCTGTIRVYYERRSGYNNDVSTSIRYKCKLAMHSPDSIWDVYWRKIASSLVRLQPWGEFSLTKLDGMTIDDSVERLRPRLC